MKRGSFVKNAITASAGTMIIPEIVPHFYGENAPGNWLECIKNRKPPISTVEVGHRSCTVCLISHIAMKVPGTLKWDPQVERFTNSELADSMLKREQRSPYGTDYIKGI